MYISIGMKKKKQSKIVSFLNLKGGVGKTTLCVTLAAIFKKNRVPPLVLDLDPQMSASMWAQNGGSNFPIDVVPLSLGDAVTAFKKNLDKCVSEYTPDVIFLDNPPELDATSQCSCLLSDLVIIPVSPSPLDLWAAEKAMLVLQEARSERESHLPKAILLPSKLQIGTIVSKDLIQTLKAFNEPISPPIYQRVSMVESTIAGTTIDNYAPNSPSHREFLQLFKFVNTHIRK